MKLFVVYNAHAGAGRARRLRPVIEAAIEAVGMAAEVHETQAPGAASQLVERASLEGFDAVVAAGGDGTLFEVVNGLCRRCIAERPALGVLPIGTGNAFVRDLGLVPGDWREALARLVRGESRRVDVARVQTGSETYYYINIIGIGFPSDAGKTAMHLKWLGRSAYTLATLREVIRLKSYRLELEVDGRRVSQDNVLLEVANSRFTGTHFLIAPGARVDDGLLDLVLLRRLSRRRILRLFPTIYSGRHVEFNEVTVMQVRRVKILEPAGMAVTVDGEFRGETPLEIECLPGELELLA